jgi:hypothetical protein
VTPAQREDLLLTFSRFRAANERYGASSLALQDAAGLTAEFTLDGDAYGPVTPDQRATLMAVSDDPVRQLNQDTETRSAGPRWFAGQKQEKRS